MKQKQILFSIFAILFAVLACSFGPETNNTATSLPPQATTAQVIQIEPSLTPAAISTATATPTQAILWPTKKINVSNITRLKPLQSWGKGRAEDVFQSPESDFQVVFGNNKVTVYQKSTQTQLYEIENVQAAAVSFVTNRLVTTHPGKPDEKTPVKIHALDTGELSSEVSYVIKNYSDWQYFTLQDAREHGITEVAGISFSPDGKILSVGFIDGTLKVWNLENTSIGNKSTESEPKEIFQQQFKYGPGFTAFSPSGKTFLVGIGRWWTYGESLKGAWSLSQLNLYQFPEMKLIKSFGNASDFDSSVAILLGKPDEQSMLLGQGLNIYQIEIETGKELASFPVGMQIELLLPAENGNELLAYTVDQSKGYPYHYFEFTLSAPDWKKSNEREVDIFGKLKTKFPEPPATELGHIPPLLGAGIVNGNIVAWGLYGDVPFWWTSANEMFTKFQIPPNMPMTFHYQDQNLLTCEKGLITNYKVDGKTEEFQLADLETCDRLLLNHKGDVLAVTSGPDIWLVKPGSSQKRYLQESDQSLHTLAFSNDDSIFAAGTIGDYDIAPNTYFWSGDAGIPISQALYPEDTNKKSPQNGEAALERDATNILGLVISRDNTIAITLTENIRIWDIKTGKQLGMIPYDLDAFVEAGVLSPDNRLLVLGDENGRLRFWNLDTLEEIKVLVDKFVIAHNGAIKSISFNEDATAIITAGLDGKIQLWGIP